LREPSAVCPNNWTLDTRVASRKFPVSATRLDRIVYGFRSTILRQISESTPSSSLTKTRACRSLPEAISSKIDQAINNRSWSFISSIIIICHVAFPCPKRERRLSYWGKNWITNDLRQRFFVKKRIWLILLLFCFAGRWYQCHCAADFSAVGAGISNLDFNRMVQGDEGATIASERL
jgi:hypothetical protein